MSNSKPNVWHLYHQKDGQLAFKLVNGNNKKNLIQSCEGYKNQQSCLGLLHAHQGPFQIYYFEPGVSMKKGTKVQLENVNGVYGIYYDSNNESNGERIYIPTASKAKKLLLKTK